MSDRRDIRSAPHRRIWWRLVDNRHFLAAALLLLPAAHFLGLRFAPDLFPTLDKFTIIHAPASWHPILVMTWVGAFAYFLIKGLASRRRSQLNRRRQSALRLKVDDRRHLRGRDDDIEFYKKVCREHRLIFLQGESGSGKSAFLAAGLYKELQTAPGELLLPILVDSWGDDWESGPFLQLAQAISKEMTPALYQSIGYKDPISYKDVKDVLIALRQRANRLPLLLFDQFDDYQARHLDKFVVSGRSINDEELTERNLFWREIRDLVVTTRVHCLFALRTDNRAGIVAVQFFHRPEVHHLSRLSGDYVTPLLAELTSAAPDQEPVIFEPDRGWDVLQKRLVKDLAPDGLVLPVQLKTALQALEQLPFLTVTEYQRVGGLIGLERTHVGLSIRAAAGVAELPERTLAMILRCLIDPQHEPRKTRALTLDELLTAAQDQGLTVSRDQLERALQHLRAKDLVRQPLATEQVPRWRLDHDYLCQAVEEVVRGFDPGLERATEWYQTYQTASGWKRFREAVRVPAWSLFVASLRDRISDHAAASFVRTRGLGWIAAVLIAAVSISIGVRSQWQETTARKLFTKSDYVGLAMASEALQHKFVDLAINDDGLGAALLADQRALRALTGIDPERRNALVEQLLESCPGLDLTKPRLGLGGQPTWRQKQHCLLMMHTLIAVPERTFDSKIDLFTFLPVLSPIRKYTTLHCTTNFPIDQKIANIINTTKLNSLNTAAIQEYQQMLFEFIITGPMCQKISWLAALESLNKNKELVFRSGAKNVPTPENSIGRLASSWNDLIEYPEKESKEHFSKEYIEKSHTIIKELIQYYAEQIKPDSMQFYLSQQLLGANGFLPESSQRHWFQSTGSVEALRPMLSRISKADSITITKKSFQQLLKLRAERQVRRDLFELLVSQWEDADVVAAFDDLVKKLDETDTEVAYPVNLSESLGALSARLGEGSRVPAMRKLVAVLTHRCAEEVLFRRVKFQKYSQLTKLMSELAQRLTDAEAAEFLQIWWQLYVSEQGAIYLSTESPMMTPQDVIYDTSESESLRIVNIEMIWADSPLRENLSSFSAGLKPGVSAVTAGLLQKLQKQPDGNPSLRYYYERRIHFLGNLIPAAQRQTVHQNLVTALGRPSLNTDKGYDALTRTQCSNIRQVIIDSYDHIEAIRRQYNPFSIPCLSEVSEADARYLLLDYLPKSAANKLITVRTNDEALSTLITAAQCSQAGCLDQIFLIMQQSSNSAQRGADPEVPLNSNLFWQKSWTAALKLLPKETVLDFLEARIAALPDPKQQTFGKFAAFTRDRDIGLLFGLLRAASGDPSVRPRIADFCAAQARVPEWHASSRKVFLRCMGATHARSMLEELEQSFWKKRRAGDRDFHPYEDVILRHLEPLPVSREWMQKYIDLFKSVNFHDGLRDALLTRMEQLTGQRFEGDPFQMAAWAKTQGYDVTTPHP